jgi:peptidoglycan hydrolase-like protein with peptidoglycan-binding domain
MLSASTARLSRFVAGAVLLFLLAFAPGALAQTLGSRTLHQGMRGSDVRALQQLLTRAGFHTPATGTFGSATEHSVAAFERQWEMKADGIVTKSVATELRNVVNGAASNGGSSFAVTATTVQPTNAPTLSKGSKGKWVRTLQSDLTFVGYPTTVDGQFGATTAQAVNAFKTAHGFTADGVVGSQTWATLLQAVQQVESTPTAKARLNPDGTVTAPSSAPPVIQTMIAAANRIATKPYCYAGGHGKWNDSCYDCSGSVSYVLHAAGMLSVSEDSTQLESYGSRGLGRWVTIWANAGHTYMQIAGLYFDTAAQSSNSLNDRWSAHNVENNSSFVVRHPTGL